MPDVYTEAPLTKRAEYEQIRSKLDQDRSSFVSHWREIGDFIRPRRPRFLLTDKNRGDKRFGKIINSAATFASGTLRAGMHAGLSSPARPWIKLGTPDPDLGEFGPVKEWLHVVTKRMLTVFAGSNLYQALPITYGDQGDFGTGAMGVLDDDEDLFRCYPYPIGSYTASVNARGLIDTFVREYPMTVRQVVKEFGRSINPATGNPTNEIDWTHVSNTVRGLWGRGAFNQDVYVNWIVTPNEDYDEAKALLNAKHKRFASCHFEKGQERDDRFLRESGFNEFPILLGRWERTGEDTYGTSCPGMIALGDVKQLQTGERKSAQAVEKMLNPPLQAPTHIRNQKASLLPGDVTYADVRDGQKGITPIHEVRFDIDKHEMKQQQVEHRIQRAYYEDLFLMLASSDRREITAREIDERHEEKLLALGPVVEGQKDDVHDKLVDRVYAMMDRNGFIPPAPKELAGVKLKVEYLSLLSQAQKLVGVSGLERFLSTAVQLAEVFPAVRHKVDSMQAVDELADMTGVNPKIVVPTDEAQAAASAEAKAQQAQQSAATMKDVTASAQQLSNTDLSGDNAASRIIDGQAERVA
jgi:hypothetical protein